MHVWSSYEVTRDAKTELVADVSAPADSHHFLAQRQGEGVAHPFDGLFSSLSG